MRPPEPTNLAKATSPLLPLAELPNARLRTLKASLFVTCLVDQFFPEVGESVVTVLRRLGVEVDFPPGQTCCGQPAFNSGFRSQAKANAECLLDLFQDSEYVVTPSGSCASMLKVFYPELFHDAPALQERADDLSRRTYELSQFLVHVLGLTDVGAAYDGTVTYHASCHLLRELEVTKEPLLLIEEVKGARFVPLDGTNECCGFGGAFSVKYPEISAAILEDKLRNIEATGADGLVACDSGCLMHIAGAMSRRGMKTQPLHLAQLLAKGGDGGG